MAMAWAPSPSILSDLSSKKIRNFTHMTFFWGTNSEILFPAFPATSTPKYFVALFFVFTLSVLTEWFTVTEATWKEDRLMMKKKKKGRLLATGMFQTGMHFLRMAVVYLLLLALMSFNGGVFVVAVLGHAVGFLGFSSGVFDYWQLRKAAAAVGAEAEVEAAATAYNVDDPSCKC